MKNGRSELAKMRWKRCLQQQEVAQMAGIRPATLSAAERGRSLSLNTACRLAAVYEVDLAEIVGAYRKGVA